MNFGWLLVVLLPLWTCPVAAASIAPDETPEDTISALWRAMSHPHGQMADVQTLQRIFHPDAILFGATHGKDAPVLRRWTVSEFLESFDPDPESGFHECEIQRSVDIQGRMAVAWSVVESRQDPASQQADFVGVNSIQLYRDGPHWKVLSLYYHVGLPGESVALDTGIPGKCLATAVPLQ